MENNNNSDEKGTLVATSDKIQSINKEEFVRLLIQALREEGFNESSKLLEKESGIHLHSSPVEEFINGIMRGDWPLVEDRLQHLQIHDYDKYLNAKFLIYQQKFLEFVDTENTKDALACLRTEITPLNRDPNKVHKLSSFLLCSKSELNTNWSVSLGRQQLIEQLNTLVEPVILVPNHRLKTLITQSLERQVSQCLYHNSNLDHISLLQDHVCSSDILPSHCVGVLEGHHNEVWCVKFSHNGEYVATGSKDTTVIVWRISDFSMKFQLKGHTEPVLNLSWSPNDKFLLSCGKESTVKLWGMETGACLKTFQKHAGPVSACMWLPDSKRFVSGGLDKNIYLMNVDGEQLYHWTSARVNDLTLSTDGLFLYVVCQEKKLRIINLETKEEVCSVQETDAPTSLELSEDNMYLLINIASHEVHLWDVVTKRLVQKYRGHKQAGIVIRSCFGGLRQSFVISGSEDSNIYVWHRANGALLKVLTGHSGIVNAVAWNPKDSAMFASCSDDHTVRIWSKKEVSSK